MAERVPGTTMLVPRMRRADLVIRASGTHERVDAGGCRSGSSSTARTTAPSCARGTRWCPSPTGCWTLCGGTQEALTSIADVMGREREPHSVVEAIRTLATGGAPEDDVSVVAVHRPMTA